MSRFRKILFLSAVCLTLLAACSGSSGAREVSFMVSGEPAELDAYQTLVDRFTETHPEIEVTMIYVASPKEFREKLGTMFSGKVPPDVFLYNYRRLGDYAEQGAVHPLDELLESSQVLERSDFFANTLEAFTYQGVLQCIPQNLSSPVIYYNRDLFTEAGLDFPAPGWTRDDFLSAAAALTVDRDGDGVTDQWGFGSEIESIRLAPFIWSNGGDFFNNPQNPSSLEIGAEDAREAIQWFVDLQLVHHVAPDIVSETAQPSEDRFLNGTVAMLMNSRVAVPALRTITAFEWDAAPLPLGDRPATVLHSDGFCMSAKAAEDAAHAADVWAFIEYAISAEGQTVLSVTGRIVPSIIEVAESPAFLDSSPPENNQVFLDAVAGMRALPMLPGWNRFEELLSKELQRVFFGDAALDEFLSQAEELAQPVLGIPGD